jgi:phenylacetate-CoA ligase
MSKLVRIYHRFPASFRSIPATARGYYLKWWRYGAETESLVEEALAREHWNGDQWKNWQEERLLMILRRAVKQVPYYRDYWSKRRASGDRSSWEVLENWPILTKETLRQNPKAFVAEDCSLSTMFEEHTSGSTGKPLVIWQKRSTVKRSFALLEARVRRWNGVSRNDRWAILGGQLVTPSTQQQPPFWVWNAGLKQLYMSSYHLSPANIPSYFDALRKYGIRYVLGYASALHALAQVAQEESICCPAIAVAINNAEPLYRHQREMIELSFRCPVRDTYGMTELVAAASECSWGKLHLWPETGILEILDDSDSKKVQNGMPGRFVCTGLINPDMPLIRYEVGDRGTLSAERGICGCGRLLPILQGVEGRLDDVILTPDGKRIGRLDPVFKSDFRIRESQIVQESLHRLHVRVVPADGYSQKDANEIVESLKERVGNMEIVVDEVVTIPRSSNGKFRSVISMIKPDQPVDTVRI